jgi:hypothetical protein
LPGNRLNNPATLLKSTNQVTEAEPLMRRTVKILEKSLNPKHPNTNLVRMSYHILRKKIKK